MYEARSAPDPAGKALIIALPYPAAVPILDREWAVQQSIYVVYQSCPRVTFLGPDPTRPGETLTRPDPTRPAMADKKSDPTRPDP